MALGHGPISSTAISDAGAATGALDKTAPVSGGVQTGGAAVASFAPVQTDSGGRYADIPFSGFPRPARERIGTVAGGVRTGGAASSARVRAYSPTGGVGFPPWSAHTVVAPAPAPVVPEFFTPAPTPAPPPVTAAPAATPAPTPAPTAAPTRNPSAFSVGGTGSVSTGGAAASAFVRAAVQEARIVRAQVRAVVGSGSRHLGGTAAVELDPTLLGLTEEELIAILFAFDDR